MIQAGLVPRTTIGTKLAIATTGLILLVFVIGHLLGDLQIFLGPDRINEYAESLRKLGPLLWIARAVLVFTLFVHIGLALRLRQLNAAARPVPYVIQHTEQASIASLSMVWSGLAIFFFVLYHLSHFTFGWTHPEHFALIRDNRHDVYNMVVRGFQQPTVSVLYILAMLCLGLHLVHAVPSLFQTLGLNTPGWARRIQIGGISLAVLIVLGNCSIPLAILMGLVKPATGV